MSHYVPNSELGKLILAMVQHVGGVEPLTFTQIDVTQALREADQFAVSSVEDRTALKDAVLAFGLRRAARETGISSSHLSRFLKGESGMANAKQQHLVQVIGFVAAPSAEQAEPTDAEMRAKGYEKVYDGTTGVSWQNGGRKPVVVVSPPASAPIAGEGKAEVVEGVEYHFGSGMRWQFRRIDGVVQTRCVAENEPWHVPSETIPPFPFDEHVANRKLIPVSPSLPQAEAAEQPKEKA